MLLEYVREGDEVHVHDISRMASKLEDVLSLVKQLNSMGGSVMLHKENLTFSGEQNAMQDLLLDILGSLFTSSSARCCYSGREKRLRIPKNKEST